MCENEDQPSPTRTKGRLFLSFAPSPDDLVRAANIPANQCPRRYCWWWQSLSFDWEQTPLEGCTFLNSLKPPDLPLVNDPCCRCDSSSTIDHYEPREPHLLEDGFPVSRWHSSNHRRPDGEISYDLLMRDDMVFAEGSYRIGYCDWNVFVVSKRPINEPTWKAFTWESGVSGVVVRVPLKLQLNVDSIESLLSEVLGVEIWERVQGPDSMYLS
jgi:hypothetical protein